MSNINLYELYGLKSALEEAIEGFYKDIFGVNVKPRMEISPYIHHLVYSPRTKEIYIPSTYLIELRNALENRNINRILDLVSLVLHVSLHQYLDEDEKKRKTDIIHAGVEVLANTLEILYSLLGGSIKENINRIKDNSKDSLSLEERLLIVNSYVIEAFLDREQLGNVERTLKARCNSEYFRRVPEFNRICSIIEEKGIYKFLEDLKRALQNPNERDKILEEYSKFLKR